MKTIITTILFLFTFPFVAQSIKVQPYPQDITTNSAYILWETNSGTESIVEWGLTNSLGNSISGSFYSATDNVSKMHEVQISGLNADTKYFYRVKTGTAVSPIYRFNTNPTQDSEKSFTFVAVSDMQNDNSNPNVFYQINHDGILDYFNTNFGGNIEDNIGLILTGGDLVMSGTTYSQWQQTYFTPAEGLIQYIGNYPILGNHEINSPNYFNYFHLPSNGPIGYNEHTWYKDYSNVRFIGLDSNYEVVNYQTQTQLDWLTATLNDAASNTNIDFVVLMLHHPYKSELWTPGEVAYTGQVITMLETFTNTTGKPSMHLFGHTHAYSRGQSKNDKHIWMDIATAGGNIDYWNEFPNADYPEFSRTEDEYGFVVFEVTAGNNPKIIAKRISRGNELTPKDNIITDTFTIYKNPKVVNTPTPISPVDQNIVLECVEFKASAFQSVETNVIHAQSQWQVHTSNNFSSPQFDSWKNFENWYNNIDTQANDNLTDEIITGLLPNTTYWWRVRYRDNEFNWSDWSSPVSFSTGNSIYTSNLLTNPGAESGMTGWTIEEGSVESLSNGQCGGPAPFEGTKLFAVGGICSDTPIGRATQTVNVSSYASLIDSGNYKVKYGAYMRDWESLDIPQVKIYFYNQSNALIGSSNWLSHNNPTWTLKQEILSIPINTRFIKFEMKGVRNNGSDNDSYIDNTFLKLSSDVIDCNSLFINQNEMGDLLIFPNPMQNSTKILVSNSNKVEIKLMDLTGKEVHIKSVKQDNSIEIFKENLQSGIYLLTIIEQGFAQKTFKLIVD